LALPEAAFVESSALPAAVFDVVGAFEQSGMAVFLRRRRGLAAGDFAGGFCVWLDGAAWGAPASGFCWAGACWDDGVLSWSIAIVFEAVVVVSGRREAVGRAIIPSVEHPKHKQ
jgi:hypothetical protein